MRKLVAILLLIPAIANAAFTEFYCNPSTGANINAGDNTANGVVTTTNGAWSTVTNIYTATSGTPFSGVSVGDFASVYLDGATVAVYIGRVTAVGGGGLTLTISSTAKSGTAPTTAATGISCTTGGAWKGPNSASGFPFGFVASTMTDSGADYPRVNLKNNTTYSITAQISDGNAGPIIFQGYTSSANDGGRAIIDGGTSGASYVLLNLTGNDNVLRDITFQNNGASASAHGLQVGGSRCVLHRVIVNSVRNQGFNLTGQYVSAVECEAYSCNQNNGGNGSGFNFQNTAGTGVRCYSHDNSGSNSYGFLISGSYVTLQDCIADTNGKLGFELEQGAGAVLLNCDAYNNTLDGIRFAAGTVSAVVENCNLIKNAAYGINRTTAGAINVQISNCGFGSGTQVNTLGDTNNLGQLLVSGSISYASGVTPWVAPTTGNFSVNLAAAKNAGRGNFTETGNSKTGTLGYPDIGAAQHQDAGGSGVSRTRHGSQ